MDADGPEQRCQLKSAAETFDRDASIVSAKERNKHGIEEIVSVFGGSISVGKTRLRGGRTDFPLLESTIESTRSQRKNLRPPDTSAIPRYSDIVGIIGEDGNSPF